MVDVERGGKGLGGRADDVKVAVEHTVGTVSVLQVS